MGELPCKYIRDVGVVCYEAPLRDDPDALVRSLRSSPIDWLWISWVKDRPARSLDTFRHLADERVAALLEDLALQYEPYSFANAIVLAGSTGLTAAVTEDALRRDILTFAAGQESPIEIMIVDPGDTPESYVFVPQRPSVAVTTLLLKWDIEARKYRTWSYSRLHSMRLEYFFGHRLSKT
jgi:hypothetical protein